MEKLIQEQLQDNFEVEIFGEPYSALNLNLEKENSHAPKQFGNSPSIVKILGIKTSWFVHKVRPAGSANCCRSSSLSYKRNLLR